MNKNYNNTNYQSDNENSTFVDNNGLSDIESRGRSNSNCSHSATSNKEGGTGAVVPLHGILRHTTKNNNNNKNIQNSSSINNNHVLDNEIRVQPQLQLREVQQQRSRRDELNALTISSLSSSGDTAVDYPYPNLNIYNNNNGRSKTILNGGDTEEETPLLRPVLNAFNLSNSSKAKYSGSKVED